MSEVPFSENALEMLLVPQARPSQVRSSRDKPPEMMCNSSLLRPQLALLLPGGRLLKAGCFTHWLQIVFMPCPYQPCISSCLPVLRWD